MYASDMNVHVYARWVTVRRRWRRQQQYLTQTEPRSRHSAAAGGRGPPGRESVRSPRRVGTAAAASRPDLTSLNLPAAGPSTPPAVPVIRHTRPGRTAAPCRRRRSDAPECEHGQSASGRRLMRQRSGRAAAIKDQCFQYLKS
jgi:hypothetical protein